MDSPAPSAPGTIHTLPNGTQLTVLTAANTALSRPAIVTKAQQKGLPEAKRLEVHNLCCKSIAGCNFKPLPTSLNSQHLHQTVTLDQNVLKLAEHLSQFQVNPFHILSPVDASTSPSLEEEGGVPKTRNLLTQYASITLHEVAAHNKFIHLWTPPSDEMQTNRAWFYNFLKFNIDPSLMS
jgi:hypothetical protein